jgi:hypothetical protein
MPPLPYSRHLLCDSVLTSDARLLLSDRVPYRYRELPDNRFHQVVAGDTLFLLAGIYFEGIPRAAGLFWVIADFQPSPIHDPTLQLTIGGTIIVPSVRVVLEDILNPLRKDEQ